MSLISPGVLSGKFCVCLNTLVYYMYINRCCISYVLTLHLVEYVMFRRLLSRVGLITEQHEPHWKPEVKSGAPHN
jgi:hypothetical protein